MKIKYAFFNKFNYINIKNRFKYINIKMKKENEIYL